MYIRRVFEIGLVEAESNIIATMSVRLLYFICEIVIGFVNIR